MDLNGLADFVLVASHGGYGKASRASGRSKTTLSRRITELEEALGVRLFERGANQLGLTEAGQMLLARTEAPLHEMWDAAQAAQEGVAVPRGHLRVAAPLLFAQLAMGRLGAQFVARYPDVVLEVVADDRAVDLVEEHFDVAIRPNPRADTALVGRCFARDALVVAAAPSIPLPAATSDTPIEVPAVLLPAFDNRAWVLDDGQLQLLPRPQMQLSSLLMVRDAVIAGAGAGLLPRSMIHKQLELGSLRQWGTAGREVELWVLHTSRRLPSPKVRAFVDFIVSAYRGGALALEG